jgi:hypothetical protein
MKKSALQKAYDAGLASDVDQKPDCPYDQKSELYEWWWRGRRDAWNKRLGGLVYAAKRIYG